MPHLNRPVARRTWTLVTVLAATVAISSSRAIAQDAADRQRNLESFIHFVIVGRGDLAAAAATALLDSKITDEELAALVDEAELTDRLDQALITGRRMVEIEAIVGDLSNRVEQGRFELATDPDRINESVGMLTGTVRQRMMARDRLAQAGPYAVRPLLTILVEGKDPVLVGEAENLLAQRIRDGAVLPLCVALPSLPPASQERVARILALIGTPGAAPSLPFLAEVATTGSTPASTAEVISGAVSRLGGSTAEAASQFTGLAERFFRQDEALVALPPMRSIDSVGQFDFWTYGGAASGLEPQPVAKQIWFDVMAMDLARRALSLDPGNSMALSIYVAANLRRGLAMASEGVEDPIFGGLRYTPAFFATAAGPSIGQSVASLAVSTKDVPLIRAAIDVLAEIAGSGSMIPAGGPQPVLDCLRYPGRRVRLEAALAIAAAMPRSAFPGDHAVVPLLASAVRTDAAFAAVIAADAEERRQVAGALAAAGFTMLPGGGSFSEAEPGILSNVGADLIVVRGGGAQVAEQITAVRGVAITSATPLVVVTTAMDADSVRQVVRDDPAAVVMISAADESVFVADVKGFLAATLGSPMSVDEAREYAILALEALRSIAMSGTTAFSILDAETALTDALAKESGSLQILIAEVLSMIATDTAQQTLIETALAGASDSAQQVQLLDQATASARRFGNRSHSSQASALTGLIQASSGEVADAAGRLYGALDLPTSQTVRWILD